MTFQLHLVIFIASAASFESRDGVIYKSYRRFDGEKRAASLEGGAGRKPQPMGLSSFIINDTIAKDVLNVFNHERSLVGASNMNYVSWTLYLESAAIAWASGCNYDAPFYLPASTYNLRLASETDDKLIQVVQELLNNTDLYYGMRSTYVTGICAVKMACSPIIVIGEQFLKGYLYIVSLPYVRGFNASVPQYTIGPACSDCPIGVEWCYNNLCRDKCSFRIAGCCRIIAPDMFQCSAPALAYWSFSCRVNPPVKFEIMLLGLLSVLFAIIW